MTSFFRINHAAAGRPGTPVPSQSRINNLQSQNFMAKLTEILENHIADENFALPQLCREIGMSRSQIFRKLKAKGVGSPSGFIRSYRLQTARLMLETTDLQIAEVAWEVGFKDAAHFTRVFKKEFGQLPKASRS